MLPEIGNDVFVYFVYIVDLKLIIEVIASFVIAFVKNPANFYHIFTIFCILHIWNRVCCLFKWVLSVAFGSVWRCRKPDVFTFVHKTLRTNLKKRLLVHNNLRMRHLYAVKHWSNFAVPIQSIRSSQCIAQS